MTWPGSNSQQGGTSPGFRLSVGTLPLQRATSWPNRGPVNAVFVDYLPIIITSISVFQVIQ